jgi:carnitine O-acetyltransferase
LQFSPPFVFLRSASSDDVGTFSLQSVLPPLPVPELEDTIRRYLDSVRPLLDDDDYARTCAAAADFVRRGGAGPRIQAAIVARARSERSFGRSWLQSWWMRETYLSVQRPLPFASTWYAVDRFDVQRQYETEKPHNVERAAKVISGLMEFYTLIQEQRLMPTVVPVPLCMDQYRRLFSTTRVPGDTVDEIVQYPASVSRHITVIRRGMYYVVPAFHASGDPLSPADFISQLEYIVKDADEHSKDSHLPVGVLTGTNRSKWAGQCVHRQGPGRARPGQADTQYCCHAMLLLLL